MDEAASVEQALVLMSSHPDLLLLEFRLPDAPATVVLQAAQALLPNPLVIVMSSEATPEDAFELPSLGVRAFLQKPFAMPRLWVVIDQVLESRPVLAPLARALVGHQSVHDVQIEVRSAMVQQALALADGNRSSAARLLHVSRQAIQKMLKRTPKKRAR